MAILGSEAASTFFPTGEVVGQTLRVGDVPVTVIGVLEEKVFRFREGQHNQFAWRNRIVAVPSGLVAGRMQGDDYHRLDRVTFRVPKIEDVADFSKELSGLVYASHRQQRDYRLDDMAKRLERQMSQGDVYNLVFMLSGVLALVGGGMVNVNIQLASLKERVREVGVKMAIGASGGEIFRGFLTEAMLLSVLGGVGGFARRHRPLLGDHEGDRHPADARADELPLGLPAGAGLRLPVRALSGLAGEPAVADGGAAL